MRDWDSIKAEMAEVPFYPGSSMRKDHVLVEESKGWDAAPRKYMYHGELTEFFTLGMLAKALNRKPGTIRKWERDGIIPRATLIKKSNDPRGTRRLYRREHIEGLIEIAKEVGIHDPRARRSVTDTEFTQKAIDLWQRLR